MTQVPRLVSLGLLAALIVLLGLMFFQVLAPFLLPLFLAAVLAMLSQPLYRKMTAWTRGRTGLAAGLTTALVLAALMIPISLGTVLAARQMYSLAGRVLKDAEWDEMFGAVNDRLKLHEWQVWLHEVTGDPVADEEQLEQELRDRLRTVATTVANKTLSFAGATPSLLGSLASIVISTLTFVVAYFYFLADGPALLDVAVQSDYKQHLLQQFDQAVRAVVVATFAAAVAQGIATGLGMRLCGSGHFFFLTLLATLTALVPLLGTWLVWGPYVLWLGFHQGDWVRAGLLAVHGGVVVGLLDNVIRSYVLHSNVKLHPLLAFVSVMGGIQLMGLWGVFVGPVVASCLHALLKIFNTELDQFSDRASPGLTPAGQLDRGPPASPGGPPPGPTPKVVPSANVSTPELVHTSAPAGTSPGSFPVGSFPPGSLPPGSLPPGSPQPAPTG
jgi:predicted PurR-regulated permease PerM